MAHLVKLNTFGGGGPPPGITRSDSVKIHCRHSLVPERPKPCSGYSALGPSGVSDQLVSLLSLAIQARVLHGSCHVLRFSHILRIFPLLGKEGNLTSQIFYLHFKYSHRPISFHRPKSCRLVSSRFTIVPAGLDNTVPVRSEGCWSSVYEKQTSLPVQRNHLSIQPYANSPERCIHCKSKYTKL